MFFKLKLLSECEGLTLKHLVYSNDKKACLFVFEGGVGARLAIDNDDEAWPELNETPPPFDYRDYNKSMLISCGVMSAEQIEALEAERVADIADRRRHAVANMIKNATCDLTVEERRALLQELGLK